jgi:nitrogen fixation protein NifU and related proteins
MSKDELDDFVEKMQARIFEERREAYGEVAFQRWLNILFMGPIDNTDGYAKVTGSCGDTMEIFLRFENDRVKEASFTTNGCGGSAVCGSFAAELALCKTPDELIEITGEEILKVLCRFPKDDEHCSFLAAGTLQEALNDYMTRKVKKRIKSEEKL